MKVESNIFEVGDSEASSGKLVEPAGNKIQSDPSPRSTPCNDTSAECVEVGELQKEDV